MNNQFEVIDIFAFSIKNKLTMVKLSKEIYDYIDSIMQMTSDLQSINANVAITPDDLSAIVIIITKIHQFISSKKEIECNNEIVTIASYYDNFHGLYTKYGTQLPVNTQISVTYIKRLNTIYIKSIIFRHYRRNDVLWSYVISGTIFKQSNFKRMGNVNKLAYKIVYNGYISDALRNEIITLNQGYGYPITII